MGAEKSSGLIDVPSNHSVEETVEKLKAILQSKGITLLALIDHSGEAATIAAGRPRQVDNTGTIDPPHFAIPLLTAAAVGAAQVMNRRRAYLSLVCALVKRNASTERTPDTVKFTLKLNSCCVQPTTA